MRKPYVLRSSEVEILLSGLTTHGHEETYKRMRDKAFMSMSSREDMDEVFLDMYEGMIKKARALDVSSEEEALLAQDMYAIASMMRNVAHQVYRAYTRAGEERDNDRFLRLVVDNNTIPVQ